MVDVWIKTLAIAGIALVVSVLIAVVIRVIVVTLGRLESRPAQPAAPAPAPQSQAGPPAEHVAAIAAAVYAMLGSHRIVHIEETRRRAGWLAEGRLAQHSSHGLEHHPRH
ncbi:MAG: hypothetical protein JNM82_03115 [Rhodocyclaceae bacterium]|nr:hypothetical protein [Rhodocyclaceae bacterium]